MDGFVTLRNDVSLKDYAKLTYGYDFDSMIDYLDEDVLKEEYASLIGKVLPFENDQRYHNRIHIQISFRSRLIYVKDDFERLWEGVNSYEYSTGVN